MERQVVIHLYENIEEKQFTTTEAERRAKKKYNKTLKGIIANIKAKMNYNKSEKGKEKNKKYNQLPKEKKEKDFGD